MSFDEFKQSYAVHKMGEQETVNAFDCGDEDLNGFILTDAPFYRKEKLAVTYTVLEKESVDKVVAFFGFEDTDDELDLSEQGGDSSIWDR
jgi:hypothetical protein